MDNAGQKKKYVWMIILGFAAPLVLIIFSLLAFAIVNFVFAGFDAGSVSPVMNILNIIILIFGTIGVVGIFVGPIVGIVGIVKLSGLKGQASATPEVAVGREGGRK